MRNAASLVGRGTVRLPLGSSSRRTGHCARKRSFDFGGKAACAQDEKGKTGVEASVAAGRGGEGGSGGWLLLLPVRVEEIKDAANRPISQGDPKNESDDDGEEQKERKQERRHIPLILQAEDGSCEPLARRKWGAGGPPQNSAIGSEATLARVDAVQCCQIRYGSRATSSLFWTHKGNWG